jgi:hypothetical protein
MKAGLGLLTGLLLVRPARSTPANEDSDQPKLDRARVNYQDTPATDGHHCGTCANFIAPTHCSLVGGEISPAGSCLSYAPRRVDLR